MPLARQLSLLEDPMALAELTPDPGADYGEVFTRRWVVELILDLVGYTPDRDLGRQVLVEPSCGTGAFLVPVAERLIESAVTHGHDLRSLGPAIRAFDLLEANAQRARKAAAQLLVDHGLDADDAEAMAGEWVTTDDFLLHGHESAFADYVVGNPPYIRLENVSRRTMDAYRRICPTMRGRADIYVGFIERGLDLLKPDGSLSFICADRWMRNQYGSDLRELVSANYAVDAVIAMHDVDAFEDDVSAYPAIVVLRNGAQGKAVVVEANAEFDEDDVPRFTAWAKRGRRRIVAEPAYEATRVDRWFTGGDLWPAGSPSQLALLADLESRFAPLQDPDTGTRVGIGVATGCDEIFITDDGDLVETDRLLPLLQAHDLTEGSARWSGRYLVNPWNGSGLVDLDRYPKLRAYLDDNQRRLRGRHIARQRPATWYRTIDRVHQDLTARPKLLIPDIKAAAHPVLDEGGHYPHHNLYYVVSDTWDLEVLGGLLLSDVANLFVGAYCVKMRGGTYRFQAQYLRRIRVPDPRTISRGDARSLARAFRDRDRVRATGVAADVYGLPAILG
ncbi:MAG TPA: N-6 DNA methylase [Microthrixaceae bacterium]|nr:N-6 DNA methylase [Microthrixaceae bacterium]HNI34484.1 N-6 DNA methylase [Microthrixaceae bacterium]HPG13918.1 N-6 DNA methylase [Microthrixaceae bacterium]